LRKKRKSFKFYTKQTKKGMRRVVRDVKGRYKRWEDATTLDEPQGEFRIVEYIFNYVNTNTQGKPSNYHNFEVRIRIAEGDYDEDEIKEMANDAMNLVFVDNQNFVDSCDVTTKEGVDTIGYSKDDKVQYKVVDLKNMQYKYPKEGLGDLEE
jgi:hypothetical protein